MTMRIMGPSGPRKELSRSDVDEASALAARLHAGQQYASQPYTVHLRAVVDTLQELGAATPELEIVAWVHDSLEDTRLSGEELAERFGDRVREFVEQLTTRAGQSEQDYLFAMDDEAFVVKLADRLANIRALGITSLPLEAQRRLLAKYVRQLPTLAGRASTIHMWAIQMVRNELNAAEQRLRAAAGQPVEAPPPEAARYYLIADRPVRLVAQPDGGLVTEAYDSQRDEFVCDLSYMGQVLFPYDPDVESVSREEFDRRTRALRGRS